MKLLGLLGAGLLGAAALLPTSASAAPATPSGATAIAVAGAYGSSRRVVVREHTVVRRGPQWHGNRWGNRRVCENRWRGGRQVRVCRTVRYRR